METELPDVDPWWFMPDGQYHRFFHGAWHVRTSEQMSEDEKLGAVPWDGDN
jgi:hypothetical protein